MIWLSFNVWSSSHGRFFSKYRIYRKGFKWTPFVKVNWRYVGKAEAKSKEINRLKIELINMNYPYYNPEYQKQEETKPNTSPIHPPKQYT